MANKTVDRFLVANLCLDVIQEKGQALSAVTLAGLVGYSVGVVKDALNLHGVELGLIPRKAEWGHGTFWGLKKMGNPNQGNPNPPEMMESYRKRQESESARRLRESLERFRLERAREGRRHA